MTTLPAGSCLAILNCDPWPDVYRRVPQPPPEQISHPAWPSESWSFLGPGPDPNRERAVTFRLVRVTGADSTGATVAEYVPLQGRDRGGFAGLATRQPLFPSEPWHCLRGTRAYPCASPRAAEHRPGARVPRLFIVGAWLLASVEGASMAVLSFVHGATPEGVSWTLATGWYLFTAWWMQTKAERRKDRAWWQAQKSEG